MIEVAVEGAVMRMEHHADCCCHYISSWLDDSEVKLIDARCIAAYRIPDRAELVLVAHQQMDAGICLCGWAKLGRSFAGHQAEELRSAGLLP